MATAQNHLRRLLREPLIHFLLLGWLIFVGLSDADLSDPTIEDNRIVLTGGDVDRLTEAWTKQWQRPPTEAELDGLIAEAVREQVLYREALALGLDRDDVVIRRHLRQKFEFLTQDLAYPTEPDEATLQVYHKAHADQYARAAKVTFSQIFFSEDRRGAAAEADAAQTLAGLHAAPGPQTADLLGDATSLAFSFTALDAAEVEAIFGPDFAAALAEMQPGRWAGPIASGYGLHLVWLSERVPGASLPFDEVRQKVKEDWVYEQRTAANEAVYRTLLDRYDVVVEPPSSPPNDVGDGS